VLLEFKPAKEGREKEESIPRVGTGTLPGENGNNHNRMKPMTIHGELQKEGGKAFLGAYNLVKRSRVPLPRLETEKKARLTVGGQGIKRGVEF